VSTHRADDEEHDEDRHQARRQGGRHARHIAIAAANAADARVHTYFAKGDPKFAASNKAEFARVAAETGGQSYTHEDTLDGGFQAMLESGICASKAPQEPVEDCACCKECMERKVTAGATP